MRKRTTIPLLIVVIVLAALGLMLYLRAKAPPEAARLLPESDAIIYVQLKTLRSATHFDQTPVRRSPYFQQFIDATGIVPERDLDSVAFALHRMPDPNGPNGPVAYSEVFVGRFDGDRLARYLASIATAQETYTGRTIYTIPVGDPPGRQLRIAQLGYDTIAASNMPTAEQIHSMLDRSRASALSTPGSSLLAARFHEVPLLSEAWGIGHIGLPFSTPDGPPGDEPGVPNGGSLPAGVEAGVPNGRSLPAGVEAGVPNGRSLPAGVEAGVPNGRSLPAGMEPGNISILGLQLPLRGDTDLVASLRYTGAAHVLSGGALHLRIEEFAPNPTAAEHTVDTLTTVLNILRGISAEQQSTQQSPQQSNRQPHNAAGEALHAVLESITLTHREDRAILNANASIDQLKALASAHNPTASPTDNILPNTPAASSATPTAPPASK